MRNALDGKTILLVEDEFLVMVLTKDLLEDMGCDVIECRDLTAGLVRTAMTPLGFDAAILDINLNGEMSYPIAVALRSLSIPFVFVTGYDFRPDNFPVAPILTKPYSIAALENTLLDVLHLPHTAVAH